MVQYATKNDVQEVVDKAVDDLSLVIKEFAYHIDQRFNDLEARVAKIEVNLEKLIVTLDHFLKRLDNIEADNAARDAQYARLERWIQEIAKKTGVELKT